MDIDNGLLGACTLSLITTPVERTNGDNNTRKLQATPVNTLIPGSTY